MNQDQKLIPFRAQPEDFTVFKDEHCYYVDKTGFIRYLIEKGDKICVFTRPRRFGKTLMLRTLQTFFEYRLDNEGRPVDNRRYFEGLNVMDAGEDVLKHLGQYPVISLSLKDMRNDTFEQVLAKLRVELGRACGAHAYLLEHPALLDFERDQFRQILSAQVDQGNLEAALGRMCDWLFKATNRKTVILLDEYDVPLQQAAIYDIQHPRSDLFNQTVRLVGNFISGGFKSNSNLAYGVITGCMRVAKESIFTGMKNPGVITVFDDIPDEYWGITEPEVRQMLSYYGIGDWYPRIEQWYDGYYYSNRRVFNPWSLLNAIRGLVNGYGENAIKAYWGLTSGNDIIDDMIDRNPRHRESLAKLMNGETMWVPIYENVSYRDLRENPDTVWSFLVYTGYLKTIHIDKNADDMLEAEVAIPNTEIKTLMKISLNRWWKNIRLASYDSKPLLQALWNGDIAGIERETCAIMDDSISVNDAKEDFYHGMMVGVLRTQGNVRSNREYGEGRPDIVFKERNRAIILELKCLLPSAVNKLPLEQQFEKVPALMQALLDEAETQIKARHYIKGLMFEDQSIEDVKAYAFCFCRKRCMVRLVA